MNDRTPLVSAVTPCYNSVRYVERCIQSVLGQDYARVEHIVQDGGSTDGTLDVLKKYSGRISWVSERDRGQSDGLNRALQRCRGDIVGVLNADDEYLPHAASWAVANLAKFPDAAVVYGDQYDVDSSSKIVHETYGQTYDFEKVLCTEIVIPAQTAFIRRSHFEQVGLRADATRRTCPDYEMWVRIGLKFPMRHVPGFVVKYRWHPASEGRQIAIIPKMVRSKREVLDRVFADPSTPAEIKRLCRRALSGVVWWGACAMMWNAEGMRGLAQLLHSLCLYPSLEHAPRLKYYFTHVEGYCPQRYQHCWQVAGQTAIRAIDGVEKSLGTIGIRRKGHYAP